MNLWAFDEPKKRVSERGEIWHARSALSAQALLSLVLLPSEYLHVRKYPGIYPGLGRDFFSSSICLLLFYGLVFSLPAFIFRLSFFQLKLHATLTLFHFAYSAKISHQTFLSTGILAEQKLASHAR